MLMVNFCGNGTEYQPLKGVFVYVYEIVTMNVPGEMLSFVYVAVINIYFDRTPNKRDFNVVICLNVQWTDQSMAQNIYNDDVNGDFGIFK